MRPRVFRQVFELGADQVTDGDQVPVGGVATGPRLGGLDAAVEPFGKAVAEPGAEVFEDAVTVLLDGGPEPLERCQAAAPGPADPLVQRLPGLRHVAAAGKHLAHGLLEAPRAGRL